MQLGLKNGHVSPPGELSLLHESHFSLCFRCTRCFFYPEDFYQRETLVKTQQATVVFCLFVAYQGECQWKKNLKISEVTRHRDGHLKLHTLVQEK